MKRALISSTIVFALLTVPALRAQVETGTITGSVTDPGGLVVPNAQVSIKSAATGRSNLLQTNETGRFQSPPRKPGDYQVSVTISGFKSSLLNVRVEVNDRISADIRLEVGEVAEKITIEASAAQLESETSTLGNVRPERAGGRASPQRAQLRLSDFPLAGRRSLL